MYRALEIISASAIPLTLAGIPLYGLLRGTDIFSAFIDGAREGLMISVSVMPYLLAMMTAVGIVRETGAMDALVSLLKPISEIFSIPPEVLPLGLMRPISGGGAEALLAEILSKYGPDSLQGIAASIAMGSTETTLYCASVYFGAANIRKTRYAIPIGLFADAVALIVSCRIARMFI